MRGRRWRRLFAPGRRAWFAGALTAAAATIPMAFAQDVRSAVGAPPTSDARGTARPLREFNDGDGRPCRVYERDVIIDGRPQQALAIVCREASGRWVLTR